MKIQIVINNTWVTENRIKFCTFAQAEEAIAQRNQLDTESRRIVPDDYPEGERAN